MALWKAPLGVCIAMAKYDPGSTFARGKPRLESAPVWRGHGDLGIPHAQVHPRRFTPAHLCPNCAHFIEPEPCRLPRDPFQCKRAPSGHRSEIAALLTTS